MTKHATRHDDLHFCTATYCLFGKVHFDFTSSTEASTHKVVFSPNTSKPKILLTRRMGCICVPKHSHHLSHIRPQETTSSYVEYVINAQRIHSTFSLKQHKSHPKRLRHHYIPSDKPAVSRLPRTNKDSPKLEGTQGVQPTVPMPNSTADQYAPPPGPPPSYRQDPASAQHVQWNRPSNQSSSEQASSSSYHNAHMNSAQGQRPSDRVHDAPPGYEAPPGPPPNWQGDKKQPPERQDYAPPPGPPPSHSNPTTSPDYAPPPGPPPSYQGSYAPPLNPPPSHHQPSSDPAPPPYDPWLAVPDNALLPPPPSIRSERSPTANATWDSAARAHAWCSANPLWRPQPHSPATLARIEAGDIGVTAPPQTRNIQLRQRGMGKTWIRTTKACQDTIFLSNLPLYSPSGKQTAIYYELKVHAMGGASEGDAGIALGFLAPPYPSWRLPGWHRASLAIHGDDGRRYVDNSFGGQDFTRAFRAGQTVGVGMVFSNAAQRGEKRHVEVFFTRDGRREGWWDLHEERDREQEDGEVGGLEGEHDLLAAVGCFGEVEFEVRFGREGWVFKP